jgi:hypothetical protein
MKLRPPKTSPVSTEAVAPSPPTLLTKIELARVLNLTSTRIIDSWVRARRISFYRLGHRTLKFSLAQVLEDLGRFEIKAVGRTTK